MGSPQSGISGELDRCIENQAAAHAAISTSPVRAMRSGPVNVAGTHPRLATMVARLLMRSGPLSWRRCLVASTHQSPSQRPRHQPNLSKRPRCRSLSAILAKPGKAVATAPIGAKPCRSRLRSTSDQTSKSLSVASTELSEISYPMRPSWRSTTSQRLECGTIRGPWGATLIGLNRSLSAVFILEKGAISAAVDAGEWVRPSPMPL